MAIRHKNAMDDDISKQAVKALNDASKQAEKAGHPRVLVREGKLIRITSEGVTVIKNIPKPRRVKQRTKTARS